MRFSALVVVGDGNGHVGCGMGKAAEIPDAIRKGKEAAMKNIIKVEMNDADSIYHGVTGEYGVGHNAYIEDEYGDTWNTYHGRPGIHGPRSSGIRRVHFGFDGEPVLDMTEELDVNPALKSVEVTVTVK